jgi:hypothetical protein
LVEAIAAARGDVTRRPRSRSLRLVSLDLTHHQLSKLLLVDVAPEPIELRVPERPGDPVVAIVAGILSLPGASALVT